MVFTSKWKPDIMLLQETNLSLAPTLGLPGYQLYFCSPRTPHTGTAIVIRNNITHMVIQEKVIFEGHAQAVELRVHTKPAVTMHVLCFYGPRELNIALEAIECLENYIAMIPLPSTPSETMVLLGGDFNTTLFPEEDRTSKTERYPRFSSALRELVDNNGLLDIWRFLKPNTEGYTFNAQRCSSRLDRFYLSTEYIRRAKEVHLIDTFSDHRGIMVKLKLELTPSYPPYWRFDNAMLNDKSFIEPLKSLIAQVAAEENDPIPKWESIKREVKEFSILYKSWSQLSTTERFNRQQYISYAEKLIATLGWDSLMAVDTPATNHLAKWATKCRPKPLKELLANGTLLSDPSSLRKYIHAYFAASHKANESSMITSDIISPNVTQSLDEQQRDYLDAPLNTTDFSDALKSLSKKKAPGVDGLTLEFYLLFWEVLKKPLADMATASFQRGCLPRTTSTSVITLMSKGGNTHDIRNWRPISLTNVDYKIIAKALSSRLTEVISSVVSSQQSYCVPGRSIFDSIAILRDLIRWKNHQTAPLAILSLDLSKAFDRVNHNFLFAVMEKMGFGSLYLQRIKTLYTNAKCMVRVTHTLTSPFTLSKGIRQGCPLSGQLYAISLEPLIKALMNTLEGIKLPSAAEKTLTVTAYADDIHILIENNDDFRKIIPTFTRYAKPSGAVLNADKSRGLWAGGWKNRTDNPLSFQWNNVGDKFLGVWIGNDLIHETQIISQQLQDKLEHALTTWLPRAAPLSLRGRVLILNQFIAPKLWHILQCHSPPQQIVKRLQSCLVNFIWSSGKHWVKGNVLTAPVNQGGLGLIDIEDKIISFRFLYIQRLIFGPSDAPWRLLAAETLKRYRNLGQVFRLFSDKTDYRRCQYTDDFYNSLIKAWTSLQPCIDQPDPSLDTRPFPTGWPPPSPLPTFYIHSTRMKTNVKLPVNKRRIYKEIRHMQNGRSWPMKGEYCDEAMLWMSLRCAPSYGKDIDIAWRLAHGRWADAKFLHATRVRQTSECPWCPGVDGDAWHLAFRCMKVTHVWKAIVKLVKQLTGKEVLYLYEIYCGIPIKKYENTGQKLANYLLTITKSAIYEEITLYFKKKTQDVKYMNRIKNKLNQRIEMERKYHENHGNLSSFLSFWGYRNVLIDKQNGTVGFNEI